MDNLGSSAEDVPVLKIFTNVHKPIGPHGHPQSWPVVAAASVLSSQAGDILADFPEPLRIGTQRRFCHSSRKQKWHSSSSYLTYD